MIRTTNIIVAALLAAAFSWPQKAEANHYDRGRLLPAACKLQNSVAAFERVLCTRPVPRHYISHAGLMAKRAARLHAGVQVAASRSRVKGDAIVLKSFARVIDRRIARFCATAHDPQLVQSWQCVVRDLEAVNCLLEQPYGAAPYLPAPAPVVQQPYQPRPYGGFQAVPPRGQIEPFNQPLRRGLDFQQQPPLSAPAYGLPAPARGDRAELGADLLRELLASLLR